MLRSLMYVIGMVTIFNFSLHPGEKKEAEKLQREAERLHKNSNTVIPSEYTEDLKIFDGMSVKEGTEFIDKMDEHKFHKLFTRIRSLFITTPGFDYEICCWRNRERYLWQSMQMRALNELFRSTGPNPEDDLRRWCYTIESWKFGLDRIGFGPYYFEAKTNHLPFLPAVGGNICIWDCFDDYLKSEILDTILTNNNFLSNEFLDVKSVVVADKKIRVTLEK